jgi:hypothetical protein
MAQMREIFPTHRILYDFYHPTQSCMCHIYLYVCMYNCVSIFCNWQAFPYPPSVNTESSDTCFWWSWYRVG